ncbi:MAG: helix-hairpin-helix domain-containing protein [Chloroflexota bacterium]
MSKEENKESNFSFSYIEYIQHLPLGTYSIIFALGGLTILGLKALQQGWEQPAPIYYQPAQPTSTPFPTATPEPIRVFINGEVVLPGVYEMPHDSILQDVLFLAGGFSDNAFIDIVNLAQPLASGMQIYIPPLPDSEVSIPLISTPPTSAKPADIIIDESNQNNGAINLNSATKAELESLPGVGPSTAQKILDYREENGPFSLIEDVMDVSGIGPAKFESMSEFITVDR